MKVNRVFLAFALLPLCVSCDRKENSRLVKTESKTKSRNVRPDNGSMNSSTDRDQLTAAFESAKSIELEDERNRKILGLAWRALEIFPDSAAEMIAYLPSGLSDKDHLIDAYIKQLMEAGLANKAIDWANSISNEKDREIALDKISLILSEASPEQAHLLLPVKDFTEKGVEPETEQLLQTWVTQNPHAAIAWTSKLPAGGARLAAYRSVFARWIITDTSSAVSWAYLQSDPNLRAESMTAVVGAFAEHPEPIREAMLGNIKTEIRKEIEQLQIDSGPKSN